MHMVKTKKLRFNIPSCLLILSLWPIIKGCEIGLYRKGNVCLPCRSPYYGNGCQLKCDCPQKDCHHVYGCENVSAGKASVSPQTVESGSVAVTGTPDEKRSKAEEKSSVFPQTVESGSVAVTGTPDEKRSKAEDNFNTTVKTRMIKKRTATKSGFLFAIIGVAALAFLITASYAYITLCNDIRERPNKIELYV